MTQSTNPSRRTVVITGAAAGIGHAIAKRFVEGGDSVLLVDRSDQIAQQAEDWRKQGFDVTHHVSDLSSEQGVQNVVDTVTNHLGRCDVLVNNAGVHPKNKGEKYRMEDIDNAQWADVVAINLTAPFLLMRGMLPLMKDNGWGRIVNIASRAGRTLIPHTGVHYGATKAGLIGMTRIVADEGAGFGVTANTVAPGRITTPLSQRSSAQVLEQAAAKIPVGRFGEPDEIAAAVHFLASDEAAYITGAVLDINGGASML